jgi:hypothetical protein
MSALSQLLLICLPQQRRATFTPSQPLSRSMALSGMTPLQDGWMLARSKAPKALKVQLALPAQMARTDCLVSKAFRAKLVQLARSVPLAQMVLLAQLA